MNIDEKYQVKQKLKMKMGLNRILGISKIIDKLRQQIQNIAACDVSVLISGDCGTGKELAARAIHYLSHRAPNSFVPVNCGAIPETLFENELFGHQKGAFTDASIHQEGLIKEAQGGTLFLDEVGVISSYNQVKLLRLLQDKEYKPLGNPKPRKADIRIVAATNTDLQSLISEGSFREDLFFRLNIVSLFIPPLRERKEDIPLLASYFIKKYAAEYIKPVRNFSPDALDALISYNWPGNIRELENKIQHAIVMTETEQITAVDLRLYDNNGTTTQNKKKNIDLENFNNAKQKAIQSFEKNYLTHLMAAFQGDVVSAAQKAGKSRTALWNLLSKYHMHPRQFYPVK